MSHSSGRRRDGKDSNLGVLPRSIPNGVLARARLLLRRVLLGPRMHVMRQVANTLRHDGKGVTMAEYSVSYEGWYVVEADDEDQALDLANKMLGGSAVVNDGETGEWQLTGVDEE